VEVVRIESLNPFLPNVQICLNTEAPSHALRGSVVTAGDARAYSEEIRPVHVRVNDHV
jgi:hypothetical protein